MTFPSIYQPHSRQSPDQFPNPLLDQRQRHVTSARPAAVAQAMGTGSRATGLLIGGIVLMLAATQARANYCGEPAPQISARSTAVPDSITTSDIQAGLYSAMSSAMTKVVASPAASASTARPADAASIEPSELLGLRHGEGVRVICKRVDGVDTQEERNFQLEDIWSIETSDGSVLISAWENDANRKVLKSARIELDLPRTDDSASTRHQPVRRANAARCMNTTTGRCSSAVEIHSSVRSLGNRYRVEQVSYVNGARTEWVVWLLDR